MKYRLAIIASHPIQYLSPLYKKLAAHPDIDLIVYFCCDFGVAPRTDPGFGVPVKWDIPVLEGYKYVFLKNISPKPSPSSFFGLINPGIFPALWKRRYSAVMIFGYSIASYLMAFGAAWFAKTPILFRGEVVLRQNRPRWFQFWKDLFLKIIFKKVAAFLSIGSPSRAFYDYYNVPPDKIFFTPYAVDNDRFIKESESAKPLSGKIRKELNFKENAPIVFFSGKLIPKKRPFDLIKAHELLLEEGMETALIFAGDGALKNELEDYVAEKKLKNIRLLGFKNQTELPKYYGLADIFVLPSDEKEVSPLVINEAMCAALPIVMSGSIPSSVDFVNNGINGFTYPVGNIKKLAACLRAIIENSDKKKQMGKKSLEIIKNWTIDASVREIARSLSPEKSAIE